MMRPPAILLMGPTGAGKTELAVQLVAHLPLEIVSVEWLPVAWMDPNVIT